MPQHFTNHQGNKKMRTSFLLFGASICAFVAGCAGPFKPQLATPDCSPTHCPVTVTVTATTPGKCTIAVDRPTISVPNDTAPRQVVWLLVGPSDYTFPKDPIDQKGDWQGNFQNPNLANPAVRFELKDLNRPRTTKQTFDYGVKVAYKGTECGVLDPVIVNEM